MNLVISESLIETLALIGSAIGTMIFTIGGVLIEYAGIQDLVSGAVTLGVWELWMGTLTLFVGVYLLGYQEFWRRLRVRMLTGPP